MMSQEHREKIQELLKCKLRGMRGAVEKMITTCWLHELPPDVAFVIAADRTRILVWPSRPLTDYIFFYNVEMFEREKSLIFDIRSDVRVADLASLIIDIDQSMPKAIDDSILRIEGIISWCGEQVEAHENRIKKEYEQQAPTLARLLEDAEAAIRDSETLQAPLGEE